MAKRKTDTDIVKVEASYEQLPDETVNYDLKNADIESLIRTIRGQKVMVDFDLAMLYGVKIKRLNEQVRRNTRRFPDDFMFQLTTEEWNILRSQIVTAKQAGNKAITLLRSQFATTKDISKIRTLPTVIDQSDIGKWSIKPSLAEKLVDNLRQLTEFGYLDAHGGNKNRTYSKHSDNIP